MMSETFFRDIMNEEKFSEAVWDGYLYEAALAHLKPDFSTSAMHDAWQCYQQDIERLEANMKRSAPDHFKRAGCLAYWLRRHSPVFDWQPLRGMPSPEQKKIRKALFDDYGNVFLAFVLGYKSCLKFERARTNKPIPEPDTDYLETVCYLMKYKSISPHAMGMIYRSLFFV